ncbi:MAG: hypothetical protein OEU36_07425 [Gammaproteobacteria bacterium]|nr:hypothetical protein [Gammaproteobacteria bacterium]
MRKVVASSVIRSAHQGESHGGVYVIDLQSGEHSQVIDWNDDTISWEGRGMDRGLRGIAFYNQEIYMAASDEIFVYDRNFTLLESYRNKYLRHCHEIFISDNKLYLSSTGFDSILVLDLDTKSFEIGYCFRHIPNQGKFIFAPYDPMSASGPPMGDTVHLNNVHVIDGTLFFACLRVPELLYVQGDTPISYAHIPTGSHNARPFLKGVLLNDTDSDRVSYVDLRGNFIETFPIIHYDQDDLLNTGLPRDHARQAFARGLCVSDDDLIVTGSSPATISLYRFGQPEPLKVATLTMDVRNSVHGLEIWPFD